ncbi:MAG: protein kinase [Candidatus Melainabacteria bacterium]|nr:protein kinase [Candidatus Melainabacteria bacterium]
MQEFKETNADDIEVDPAIVPVDLFTPIALLGQGALGHVYLCTDKRLGKKVAVKCLSSVTNDRVVSFHNEAKIASKLNHRSVIRILDFGIAGGGRPYMVMEFFDGRSLQDILDESKTLGGNSARIDNALPEQEGLELFIEVCDALKYLHLNGVFHRDLKPSNILVRQNEEGKVEIKLIDFNLSKTTQDIQSKTTVQGRTVVGTPMYMSPDQVAGLTYDARSEVYSLGCVMYETLTGVPVFEGATALDILNKHANDPIVSPLEFNSELSQKTAAIIEQCLNKNPDARYQTIQQLMEDLERCSGRLFSDWQKETNSTANLPGLSDAVQRKQIFGTDFLNRVESAPPPRKVRWVIPAICLSLLLLIAVSAAVVNINKAPALPKVSSISNISNSIKSFPDPSAHVAPVSSVLVGNEVSGGVAAAKREIEKGETAINIALSLNDDDLKYFADKHNVTRLNLPECTITDAGLFHLSGMKKLDHLGLDRTDIRTLAAIPRLKNLRSLSIKATPIDDGALLNLRGTKIEVLRISNNPITDKGVANLVGVPINDLDISDTEITNKSVETLLTFKNLRYLAVRNTKIDMDGARKLATDLRKLYCLDVGKGAFSAQQRQTLEHEFPTIRFKTESISRFTLLSHKAHKLIDENRLPEALVKLKECENMLKNRFGQSNKNTQNYVQLQMYCTKLLKKQREQNARNGGKKGE